MKQHPILLAAPLALLAAPAFCAESASPSSNREVAELRKQVEALQASVEKLQQQVNQNRLAPVFADAASGKAAVYAQAPKPAPRKRDDDDDDDRPSCLDPKGVLKDFHLEIGVTLDAIGSYSRQARNVNLIIRDAELTLQAKVDEFTRAYFVFNAETELNPREKSSAFNGAKLGIEEAAVETTNLPFGLGIKAGQFFAKFTRLGGVHSDDLPFVDRPPRRGVELSWAPEVVFSPKLIVGVVDNLGADQPLWATRYDKDPASKDEGSSNDAFTRGRSNRDFRDLTYYTRGVANLDLGSQTRLSLGTDYLQGADSATRKLWSGDFLLSWKPGRGEELLEISGEVLAGTGGGEFADGKTTVTGDSRANANARGGYVYAQYRLDKQWQPGVRFDRLHSDGWTSTTTATDPIAAKRTSTDTYSAYLNYHLSKTNRLRFQTNYVKLNPSLNDWQFLLQWTIEFKSAAGTSTGKGCCDN
jgi:hypothetical protein